MYQLAHDLLADVLLFLLLTGQCNDNATVSNSTLKLLHHLLVGGRATVFS